MKNARKIERSKRFHFHDAIISGVKHRDVLSAPRRKSSEKRSVYNQRLNAEKEKHARFMQSKGVWRSLFPAIETLPRGEKAILTGMLATTYAVGTACQPQEVSQHLAANWAGYLGSGGPRKAQGDLDRLRNRGIVDCLAPAAGNRGAYYRIRPLDQVWPRLQNETNAPDGEGTQNGQAPGNCVPPEGTQTANCVPPQGTQTGVSKKTQGLKEESETNQQEKNALIPPSQLKSMVADFLTTLGTPGKPGTNLGTESPSSPAAPEKAPEPTETPQATTTAPEPPSPPVTVDAAPEAATDTQEPTGEALATVATPETPAPGPAADMDLDELLALETPAMAPSAPAIEEIQEQLEHHRSGQDEWQTSQRVQALGGGIDLRRRKRRITTRDNDNKKKFSYRFGGGKAQALGRDANRFLGQLRPKKGGGKRG
jgi:hypothetical protein